MSEATMAIRQESIETLLHEAREELAEIDVRRKELIDLIDNLRRHLPKQIENSLLSSTNDIVRKPYLPAPMVIRRRKKPVHAERIAKILAQSGKTMKVSEIIAIYREKGWKLTKNASDILRTAILNRGDLFDYKEGGYVALKDRQ
jgi:hypothetical protein